MISYIKGTLAQVSGNIVTIETGGIGYELLATNAAIVGLPPIGKEAKLFAYLNVREDSMSLFGFRTIEEKQMFNKLTTVSGVGAKIAMGILSGMELSSLALCIITGDTKSISKIKGIGKKTAERIILELKEKVSAQDTDTAIDAVQVGMLPQGADKDSLDAITALRTLGISTQEANRAVASVRATSATIEQLITNALKSLNG